MADYRCPDCGSPVSAGAVVCPQCGFPIRQNALPGRPGGGSGGGGLVVGLVVAAFLGVMFIGFVAAIAIPQFTKATRMMKEMEGETLLRWAYTAEGQYRTGHGMYTASVAQLTDPPRPNPGGPERYTLQVSAASDRYLCLEAVPKAAGVRALSMDEDGAIYRAAGCSGPPDSPTGAGDEGQRQMLREVHESIVAYRDAHDGTNPTVLRDMITRVHDTAASARYTLTVLRADEYGVCVAAFPRNPLGGQTALSVDQDGFIYGSPACTGGTVEEPGASSAPGGAEPSDAEEAKPAAKP